MVPGKPKSFGCFCTNLDELYFASETVCFFYTFEETLSRFF